MSRSRHGAAAATNGFAPAPGGIVSIRTYRLAFLTDKSYADEFGSANVFAEKTTLVNRVNEVYNDDLAVRFEMVPGTDTELSFDTDAEQTGTDGPCGANPCFTEDELAVRPIHRLLHGSPRGSDLLEALTAALFDASPAEADLDLPDRMVRAGALGLVLPGGEA